MGNDILGIINDLCDPEEIGELTKMLLSVPSPQTELFEDEPLVKDFIKKVVKPYLEGIGIPAYLDGMGNLIATVGQGKPGIALISYAMTAQAGSMKDAYRGQLVPGEPYGYSSVCIRGRGSCEQMGALGAMLAALKIILAVREQLKGTVTFICSTAGETGRHDALNHILESKGLQAEIAVIGLGTANAICLGNKGRVDVLVEVYGKSCHSSVPHEGINAIEGAAKVLNILGELKPEATHPYLGKSTFAPMYIESFPKATHTIQDKCVISYDRRLLPGESPEGALAEIEHLLSGIKDYKIEVKKGPFMYPSEIGKEAKVARCLAGAIRTVTNREATYTYFNSALDAGLLNRAGIECLMFGPGDVKFAHTEEEVVPLEQVVDAAKIYANAVLNYLRR
ncbi:MAG: M20/M25/M40 family metallo-hydrolase [bacterium]